MIDRRHIGHVFPVHCTDVERGRLRFFAKAIGETNPIYVDDVAARNAGHRALPAPPTYAYSLLLDRADPFDIVRTLELDLGKGLHGEQSFTYHAQIYAGDTIAFQTRISDIYDKKNGALEFIVLDTEAHNQGGALVAELRQIIVMRNG